MCARGLGSSLLLLGGLSLAPADFTARDAQFKGFRIKGSVSTKGTGIYGVNADGSRRWEPGKATVELAFQNDFLLEANGSRWRFQRLGDHPMTISGDADAPLITEDVVTFQRKPEQGGNANLEPVGVHHPALALGFGKLTHVARRTEKGFEALEGDLPVYGKVRITLSPGAPMEPIAMETLSGSGYRRYEYQGYKSFGDYRLPTRVLGILSESKEAVGPQDNVQRIELQIEDFEPISDLPPSPRWLLPGKIVIDERLGPPVRYTYEELRARSRSGEMTPAELLALTRLRLGQQGTPPPVPNSKASSALPVAATVVLVLAGAGLAAYALKKRA